MNVDVVSRVTNAEGRRCVESMKGKSDKNLLEMGPKLIFTTAVIICSILLLFLVDERRRQNYPVPEKPRPVSYVNYTHIEIGAKTKAENEKNAGKT